jgi:nucleotidyltransferase-like protein
MSDITRPKLDTARFLLRLPRGLYLRLQRVAAAQSVSLNEYCVRRLAVGGAGLAADPSALEVVERAAVVGGDALAGVIVYGSWARGSAGPASDVDVLIVLDATRPLTRALYREWDARPVAWDGRPVDPHFVQLPPDGPASGVWAEAAVDGVILFESGLRLSAVLGQVRRDIVAGRLVRRVAHGQPYWVAA